MAFEREDLNAMGERVRQRLAVCEQQFCVTDTDKWMNEMRFAPR